MLFSSYRKADYEDPDGFIASLGVVLSQYSDEVILYVTRPETGIQRKVKWPPTINEVVEACDEHSAWLARVEKFRNWGSEPEDQGLLAAPRNKRPTYDELKAKYGDNWGIQTQEGLSSKKATPAPTVEELSKHYADYGLSFKPKAMS